MTQLEQMKDWLLRLETALNNRNHAALLRLYNENAKNEYWMWYDLYLPDEILERYNVLTDRVNQFLYRI